MGNQMLNWRAVQEKHASVLNFLEWAEEKYGLAFDWQSAEDGTPLQIKSLVDKFYDVDRQVLDDERKALLASLNKDGDGTAPDG